jgi:alkanesulfonate monooxygenase SsuD/methylene tetrahydromethanopterin reductase-like flavin-dependent oxidoreductase (luciferase family)
MAASTVDRYADGRLRLGTGVSTTTVDEDLHGLPSEQPVRRAYETIAVVRRFSADVDDPVRHDGELFDAADFEGLGADGPVYHAAPGSANRRVVL